MKVGILTFHRSINYGAFLQAYALSKLLKQELPSAQVEIIDFQYQKSYRDYLFKILVSTDYFGQYRNYKMYRSFQNSLKALPLSSRTFISDDTDEICTYINNNYDLVISGSDAIFGKRPLPNMFWLNGINVPHKASYAASGHGRDFDVIPTGQLEKMKMALESFDYVGVRDWETEKMLLSADETLDVHRNCDPSIFLDINDYERGWVNESKIEILTKKKIIGVMLHDNKINKLIKERYGKTHTIVSLYRHNPYANVYLYDLNPFEWSRVFRNFEVLITKYFHGSIFCLKNLVPVIAIDYSANVDKYCCKLHDLFLKLEMQGCYFKKKDIDSPENVKHFLDMIDFVLLGSRAEQRVQIVDALKKECKHVNSFLEYIHSV